ncbi:MAG: hypothetical protein M0R74_15380 [Dehalococcoidia bacterium]|nr:hypothetical protein [Dehalococcoidia bacterium]
MKTKDEIMEMSKSELVKYYNSKEFRAETKKENSGCTDCYGCRNIKNKKYMICNIQLTRKEYKKKIKELEGESK